MNILLDLPNDVITIYLDKNLLSLMHIYVQNFSSVMDISLGTISSAILESFAGKVGVTGTHINAPTCIVREFFLYRSPNIGFTYYPIQLFNYNQFVFSPVLPINYTHLALVNITTIVITSLEFCLEKFFLLLCILIYIFKIFGFLINIFFFLLLLFLLYSENVSNNIISIIIFAYLVPGVFALGGYGDTLTFTLFDSVGLILYILILALYDYMLIRRYLMNRPLFSNI